MRISVTESLALYCVADSSENEGGNAERVQRGRDKTSIVLKKLEYAPRFGQPMDEARVRGFRVLWSTFEISPLKNLPHEI